MAKKSKVRYVKLGEKASSFSDPTSKLKLTPNVAVKLEKRHKQSRRVLNAIKAGHLEYCDKDEFDNMDGNGNGKDDDDGNGNGNDTQLHTEKLLMKKKKKALIKIATEMETDQTALDLDEMTKAELSEEILELQKEQE